MKRFAIIAVTLLATWAASASTVHYFTRSQASRAVSYLNRQNEVMIYCGYEYELETYVLVNEVWAEQVNSAFYELWIFGYDAYTGEEVYMPLDLQCVWLYSAGRMHNAAQTLRFRTQSLHRPSFTWYIPEYRPFTRLPHRHGYSRTYHYNVHVYGWMPPARPVITPGMPTPPPPIHPYYMRTPNTPAPRPTAAWTPGTDRPHLAAPDAAGRSNSVRSGATTVNTGTPATAPAAPRSGAATSSPSRSNTRTGTTSTTPSRNSIQSGTTRNGTSTSPQPSNNSRNATTTTTQPSSNSRSGATTTQSPTNARSGNTTSSSRASGSTRSGSQGRR